MRTFAVTLLASGVLAFEADPLQHAFLKYMSKFGKQYTTLYEFTERFANFARNNDIIEKHNSIEGRKFEMGHNKFSDFSEEEYLDMLNFTENFRSSYDIPTAQINTDVPTSIDWRDMGAVNPIQD